MEASGGALNGAAGRGCGGRPPTPDFWCDQPELAVRGTTEPRVAWCFPSSLQTGLRPGHGPYGPLGAAVGGGLAVGGQRWWEDRESQAGSGQGGVAHGLRGLERGNPGNILWELRGPQGLALAGDVGAYKVEAFICLCRAPLCRRSPRGLGAGAPHESGLVRLPLSSPAGS